VNEQTSYTIDSLSETVGIPIRTIRFYISEGLLPGPGARGKAATYSEEQLLQLRLIRRLVEERVALAEIRERLASLTTEEMRGLLADEERRTAALDRAADRSPRDYIAALLDQARARIPRPAGGPAGGMSGLPRDVTMFSFGSSARKRSTVSDHWRRISLAPGIELHVRSDAETQNAELIDDIVNRARQRGAYHAGE
jgi:DNA-binding transcriptional MerR regulator